MTDTIHTCSYFCDRPDCIKAQRDELRDRIAMVVSADKQPEALTLELKRGAAARPHDVEARSLMNAAASAIATLEAENVELRAKKSQAIAREAQALEILADCQSQLKRIDSVLGSVQEHGCGSVAQRLSAALKETP